MQYFSIFLFLLILALIAAMCLIVVMFLKWRENAANNEFNLSRRTLPREIGANQVEGLKLRKTELCMKSTGEMYRRETWNDGKAKGLSLIVESEVLDAFTPGCKKTYFHDFF